MVHCAVAANQSGAVEAETQWQALQRSFLEALIKRALQECAVHGHERLPASLGKTAHHVGGVTLADAGVPDAVGELGLHLGDARAVWHGSGARHHLWIARHQVGHRFAERCGEGSTALLQFNAAAFVLHVVEHVEGAR